MSLLLLSLAAFATPSFDPSTPEARFTGDQVYTQDGTVQLWSAIERHSDPDRTLFTQEEFNSGIEWPLESDYAPWIDECFGSQRPHSSTFLLHMGMGEESASGTPILFVHGAGDNGSRSFITMATRMDQSGRPVYALTFAHPHGDVLQQAEVIADAVARIKARTGAAQIDLVAHSKGGIAAAVYLSHTDGAVWGSDAYESVGTPYRGDVRRAVFIATPLGGIDSTYRWPNNSLVSLDADAAISPSAWRRYYPYTTLYLTVYEDLSAQDLLSDGEGDLFPGHRQMLRRQDYPLPGSLPWLGTYALQLDYLTSYEGGYGAYSYSDGVDGAAADGGDLLDRLEAQGVDPSVELFLLAGENPIMPNGDEEWLTELFGEAWSELIAAGQEQISELAARLVEEGLVEVDFEESDIAGLESGDLVLGEVSGPSDGLVFVTSATYAAALTARGAPVVESRVANLSHMDLLYASPITGALLLKAAEEDPENNAWMTGFGTRYTEEDTLGWVEGVLADPETPEDTGDTGEIGGEDSGDTGEVGGEDSGDPPDPADDTGAAPDETEEPGGSGAGGGPGGCEGCASAHPRPLSWLGVLALALTLRRRR